MCRGDDAIGEYIDCYTLASHGDVQAKPWIHHHAVDSTTTSTQLPLPVADDHMRASVDSGGTAGMSQSGDGARMMQLLRDIAFRQIDSVPDCMPQPSPQSSHCVVFVVDDDVDSTSTVRQSVPTPPQPNPNPTPPPVPAKPTNLSAGGSRCSRQRATDRHSQRDVDGRVCRLPETQPWMTTDVSGVMTLADEVSSRSTEQNPAAAAAAAAVDDTCALPAPFSTVDKLASSPECKDNFDETELSSDDNYDHDADEAVSDRCAAAATAADDVDDDDDDVIVVADDCRADRAAVTDDSQPSHSAVSCSTATSSPASSLPSSADSAATAAAAADSVDSHVSATGVCIQPQPTAVPLPLVHSSRTLTEQIDSECKRQQQQQQQADTADKHHHHESDDTAAAAAAEPVRDSSAARATDIERLYSLVRKKKPDTDRRQSPATRSVSLVACESVKLPLGSAAETMSLQKRTVTQADEIQPSSGRHQRTFDATISTTAAAAADDDDDDNDTSSYHHHHHQASSSSSSSVGADVPSLLSNATNPTAVYSSRGLEVLAASACSSASSLSVPRAGRGVGHVTRVTSQTGAGAPRSRRVMLPRGSLLLKKVKVKSAVPLRSVGGVLISLSKPLSP